MTASFQRARSDDNKRQRSAELVAAARHLARESGVASVTLTAIAERAGVHHSAVRRYFASHKDILLTLAAEGWTRWASAAGDELSARTPVTPAVLAEALASTLNADPLFCDLLANVPLHLEHDVDIERVAAFKRVSRPAVLALASSVGRALPGLGTQGALDVVTAANALAATLWQVAHPSALLRSAYGNDPTIGPTLNVDFVPTLTRLLEATCTGLLPR